MQQLLGPLSSERERIDRIAARLHETADTVERADLGGELVRAVSRYEDTIEQAVVPRLSGVVPDDELDAQARRRTKLRDAMTVVHERTMHLDPRNVHAPDPEGFEQALDDVLCCVEEQLPAEDRALSRLVGQLQATEREELAKSVVSAAKHASERPHPPATAIGRRVANAHVKLDHALEDVATPHHPGAEVIDGRTVPDPAQRGTKRSP